MQPSKKADIPCEDTSVLVAGVKRGDLDAGERLFARYVPFLRRWASGRLPQWARDLADTHDLVQDTLLRTLKNLDGFEYRGEGAFRAYVKQALLNRIREEMRRTCRPRAREELSDVYVDPSPSPLDVAASARIRERYERALSSLRIEDQQAIVARVELGFTYQELAERQNRPTADAARKATYRALLRLIDEMTA